MWVFIEHACEKNKNWGVKHYNLDDIKKVEIHDCPELGDFNPYTMIDDQMSALPPGGPDDPLWMVPLNHTDSSIGIGFSATARGKNWLD